MGLFNDIKKKFGLEDWTWNEIVNKTKDTDYDTPGFKFIDWGKDTINAITGKSNVEETRRANEENAALSRENIEMQEKYNNEQIRLADEAAAFEKEKFEYDKYLNENQNQIAANDRSAAGLNPIGQANLSTVSVGGLPSTINGSAPQHTNNVVAGMYDTSVMTQAAKSAFDVWSAKKNNKLAGESLDLAKDELNFKKESNKTQMDINKAQADISRYAAITDRIETIVTMANAGFSTNFINKTLQLEEKLTDDDIKRLVNTWNLRDKNVEADTSNKEAGTNATNQEARRTKVTADWEEKTGTPIDLVGNKSKEVIGSATIAAHGLGAAAKLSGVTKDKEGNIKPKPFYTNKAEEISISDDPTEAIKDMKKWGYSMSLAKTIYTSKFGAVKNSDWARLWRETKIE